ncbi:MAG TPA: 6,7-dimethyl-8-ribityllumazine synthase [Candidatus Udaeobacter sp.]|jgi:6,7-dimethyl-8-ribityllumazine synthase|nr:6,7-dimethyl-8-ribityllumazine synthase [Candidatus Udaeobacter sp.]
MAIEHAVSHDAAGLRFAVLASRFNEEIVRRLSDAAIEVLERRGAEPSAIERFWVPGSFELPLAARWAAGTGRFDAVLAFGAVIQGETEHFRLVSDAASSGLLSVAADTGLPVLNGVLAVYDAAQAESRSGGALGNRGAEVALAAVQMARLRRTFGAG